MPKRGRGGNQPTEAGRNTRRVTARIAVPMRNFGRARSGDWTKRRDDTRVSRCEARTQARVAMQLRTGVHDYTPGFATIPKRFKRVWSCVRVIPRTAAACVLLPFV